MTVYRNFLKALAMTLLGSSLMACGFHLRGQDYCHLPMQKIHIQSSSPYGDLEQQLRIAFARASVKVDENCEAPFTVVIKGKGFHHSTPSIGTSNQTRVFSFFYDVDYDLINRQHQPILSNQHIHVTHHIAVPPGQLLSSNNQVEILRRYMVHDAITQLFHRLNTSNVRQQLTSCYRPMHS